MEKEIIDIINAFDSSSVRETERFLEDATKVMKSLLPSIIILMKTLNASKSSQLSKFISLQDEVLYNFTYPLIDVYKSFLKEKIDTKKAQLLLKGNKLLQGLLLLHPNSRTIFNRKENMKVILGYLDMQLDDCLELATELTVSFITTLIHILLKDLSNFRVFEEVNGCSLVIRKLRLSPSGSNGEFDLSLSQDLNFKIIEFLVLYLVDEKEIRSQAPRKTIKEKAGYFRLDFAEIDSLIENLNDLKSA